MAVLPATGSAIKMGGVKQAYSNVAPAGGQNISLTGTLGSYISRSAGVATSLSATFGGRTTPYTYS
jgi:hypothetical protein